MFFHQVAAHLRVNDLILEIIVAFSVFSISFADRDHLIPSLVSLVFALVMRCTSFVPEIDPQVRINRIHLCLFI